MSFVANRPHLSKNERLNPRRSHLITIPIAILRCTKPLIKLELRFIDPSILARPPIWEPAELRTAILNAMESDFNNPRNVNEEEPRTDRSLIVRGTDDDAGGSEHSSSEKCPIPWDQRMEF